MSKRLYSFDEFLKESDQSVRQDADKLESDVKEILHRRIWEGVENSTYFTIDEKESLRLIMEELNMDCDTLNESILGMMRKAVGQLVDKGAKIKEEALDKLENIMKSASAFAKYLKDLLLKAWDKLIGYFQKKYAKAADEIKQGLKKGELREKLLKKGLTEEVKNLKDTCKFWLAEFPKKFSNAITGVYSTEILKECLEFNGDLVLELSKFDPNNLPLFEADEEVTDDAEVKKEKTEKGDEKGPWAFLNKIKHKVEKVPPFSWLEKVAELAAVGAEKVLGLFSEMTKKAGGPGVFEFAGLAALIGLFIEYKVKHFGLDAVEEIFKSEGILRFLPVARGVINTVEWIAIFLLVIKVAEELMKEAEKPQGAQTATA